jgi:hypothetical protein
MPSDITGSEVLEEDQATGKRHFRFVAGPVFCNLLLADEINRTPPKTQAALLQAMQEAASPRAARPTRCRSPSTCSRPRTRSSRRAPTPLPEAQLDRFHVQIAVRYPDAEAERRIVALGTETRARRSPPCSPPPSSWPTRPSCAASPCPSRSSPTSSPSSAPPAPANPAARPPSASSSSGAQAPAPASSWSPPPRPAPPSTAAPPSPSPTSAPSPARARAPAGPQLRRREPLSRRPARPRQHLSRRPARPRQLSHRRRKPLRDRIWPVFRAGFGAAFAPRDPPATGTRGGFTFDLTLGASIGLHRHVFLWPELGYSLAVRDARTGHFMLAGLTPMFGTRMAQIGPSPRLIAGNAWGAPGVGVRSGLVISLIHGLMIFEGGHQWLRAGGRDLHDGRFMISIDLVVGLTVFTIFRGAARVARWLR